METKLIFVLLIIYEFTLNRGSCGILPLEDNITGHLSQVPSWLLTLNLTIPGCPRLPNDAAYLSHQFVLSKNNEDKYLNVTQLANKYGYKTEVHEVITEDEYIMKLIRLPGSGEVIFFEHALFCSADDWVTPGPNKSLPYIFCDLGYDVWLGNARGSRYSRKHVRLNPDTDLEFWDFSFHEIGFYDLPASIDHILNLTGQTKLHFVGHAQGATVFYVMCSERPEYNEKIKSMIGVSATAWLSHTKSPLLLSLGYGSPVLNFTAELLGAGEFIPDNPLTKTLREALCGSVLLASTLCANILYLIAGYDYGQMNYTQYPVILSHIPSPCATKQVVHFGQLIVSGEFCKYDYGAQNIEKYNTATPPKYNLTAVSAPTAIFFGEGDYVATYEDVSLLNKSLSNVIDFYVVPFRCFNHLDFLWAVDIHLISSRMLSIIQNYS